MKLRLVFVSLVCLGANTSALSQVQKPAASDTPVVEVTAYRLPTLLTDTTQGVSLVGRKEIEARNPASTVDLIQQVPGVHVDQAGNAGGIGSLYIRGSDPENVLVLIDGVRVNDSTLSRGGSYDLSTLNPAEIERIEVVKGPASALYGTDGTGGLINIVTHYPKGDGFHASVNGGTGGAGFQRLGASGAFSSENVRIALGASKLKDGKQSEGGDLDVNSFNGSVTLKPTAAFSARIFGRHNDRDSTGFPDTSGGIRYSVFRTLEQRDSKENTIGADLSFAPNETMTLRALVTNYKRTENIDSPGVSPLSSVGANVSRSVFERSSSLLSAAFNLPHDVDLLVGYEHQRENGTNQGVQTFQFFTLPSAFDLTRKTNSVFGEVKAMPITDLILTLGLRRDTISNLKSETNPSVGARYEFGKSGTTLKAHYAEGFRAPSFFALGEPNFGNPALLPETSKTSEIGIEQAFLDNKFRIALSAFETETKNLVDFDFLIFRLVNRNKVDAHGGELEFIAKPIDTLMIAVSHSYVHAKIVDSVTQLAHRPRNRSGLRVSFDPDDKLSFFWSTAYVSSSFDTSGPTGTVELNSFVRTDVGVTYRWKEIAATFNVDNLFDKHYEQYVGFTNPGIRLRLGLSAAF